VRFGSSVAATLLKEDSYKVIGVTMKIWDGETLDNMERKGNHHAWPGRD